MRLRFSALTFAIALLTSTVCRATIITFSGLNASGAPAFTSYSESGYNVNKTAGMLNVGPNFGDPVPDLYTYSGNSGTIAVTTAGNFTFSGIDFANEPGVNGSYSIVGLLGGMQIFSTTGSISGLQAFAPYATMYGADVIDRLQITLTAPGESDLDNISVNAVAVTPEPSSFVLLGTGVLGVAGAMRRRLFA